VAAATPAVVPVSISHSSSCSWWHQPLQQLILVASATPAVVSGGGNHSSSCFANLLSAILLTCPYNIYCFVLISSKIKVIKPIFYLIRWFGVLFFLDSPADCRKNSIPLPIFCFILKMP
jgi:hypothetical protein